MNRTTRRGRQEGAAELARWKEYGFESVEACLHHQEQVYDQEMRVVERHKALPKARWQRALLREQECYLGGLIAGARTMADELRRSARIGTPGHEYDPVDVTTRGWAGECDRATMSRMQHQEVSVTNGGEE